MEESMKFKKSLFIFVIIFHFINYLSATEIDSKLKVGADSIDPVDLYNYCKSISSEKFAGRLTGHEGYTAAAKWAAAKFKKWGLKPISQTDGFLQPYHSPYTIVESAKMTLFDRADKNQEGKKEWKSTSLKLGKDFLPLLYSDSGDHRAKMVFAGWGICAPELNYDDYSGLVVKDKFVLCFRGVPDRAKGRFTSYDHHRFRMKTAKEKGALGLIYIYPEPIANPNGDWIKNFTPAIISEKVMDKLLSGSGKTAKELKKQLKTTKQPNSFALQSELSFQVNSTHFPKGTGYNVAGYIEGSEQGLKNECLVIGGHYDHCGIHMGYHYPGANDNASGSAAVMGIAYGYAHSGVKPKRSVVFVLFGGEETGLTGSTYFANHLQKPFTKVDTMVNFDMVGEGDAAFCMVSPKPASLKETFERANKSINTIKGWRLLNRIGVRSGDISPFFAIGAKIVYFMSNGPHLHYHLTGDTIYRINPDVMADIAKVAFLGTYYWADR